MNLIINGDDLGMTVSRNSAIFRLMEERRITSATILANAPAFEDCVVQTSKYPNCSFGVHLNLTEFRPLTAPPGLAILLDDKGNFAPTRIREVKINRTLADAIFDEWSAQIKLVRSAGVRVSHLDSHHHVHTIPTLFPVLKRLQKAFDILRIRISMNLYPHNEPVNSLLLCKKKIWNTALKYWGRTVTTQGFTTLAVFHDVGSRRSLVADSFELMIHRGGPDHDDEIALLRGPWRKQLRFDTKLISYNELDD